MFTQREQALLTMVVSVGLALVLYIAQIADSGDVDYLSFARPIIVVAFSHRLWKVLAITLTLNSLPKDPDPCSNPNSHGKAMQIFLRYPILP